jgi:hypothetical protein
MWMLVIINKFAHEKHLICATLHFILQHEKPNLHITYNNNHTTIACKIDDKQREIEKRPQKVERETLKKKITTSIVTMFFSHILGKIGRSAHVASQRSSILGYQAIVKKIICFKTFKVP